MRGVREPPGPSAGALGVAALPAAAGRLGPAGGRGDVGVEGVVGSLGSPGTPGALGGGVVSDGPVNGAGPQVTPLCAVTIDGKRRLAAKTPTTMIDFCICAYRERDRWEATFGDRGWPAEDLADRRGLGSQGQSKVVPACRTNLFASVPAARAVSASTIQRVGRPARLRPSEHGNADGSTV